MPSYSLDDSKLNRFRDMNIVILRHYSLISKLTFRSNYQSCEFEDNTIQT
jgi:hypothetical protein